MLFSGASVLSIAFLVAIVSAWAVSAFCSEKKKLSFTTVEGVDDKHNLALQIMGEEVATLLCHQASATCQEVNQVGDIVSDAITKLNSSFQGLHGNIKNQQSILLSLLQRMTKNNANENITAINGSSNETIKNVASKSFASEIQRMLDCLVAQIVENSQQSMTIVRKIDDIIARVEGVEIFLGDLKNITEPTHLLVLNAASTVGGVSGVTDKVQTLSQHSNGFSAQISEEIQNIQLDLESVKITIGTMASKDKASKNRRMMIKTKTRINSMLAELKSSDEFLSQKINEMTMLTASIDENVQSIVVSLQFEDMVSQLVAFSKQRLELIQNMPVEVWADIIKYNAHKNENNVDVGVVNEQLNQKITSYKENFQRLMQTSISQQDLAEGDIDLF